MGFRITTNMMMNTYRYNLMNSTNTLSDSVDKVQTKRNFNSYAEDPAAASQAFRLRRQWCQTSSQLDNTDATYSKFHTAWTNLGGIIKDLSDANGRVSAIRGNSDTSGESRKALAQVLRETADSVVQSMNQKVGEQFIFAGNDGLNVPFTWNEDHTKLYYRGVNVNAGGVQKPTTPEPTGWGAIDTTKGTYLPENMPSSSADPDKQAWIDYYKDQADVKKLEIMNKEELPLDMGMGLKEINGVLVNGSAFDSALRGISFLNYGVDEKTGDPNSLPLVMRELADVFETWGENGQRYLPEAYRDKSYKEIQAILEDKDSPEAKEIIEYHDAMQAKAYRLMDKLNAAQAHTTEKYVELDAKSSFLQSNSSRLSTEVTNLNEQVLNVEQIDLADAITQLSWDQMCYNAALKIGTQLLSQSLIDYMN